MKTILVCNQKGGVGKSLVADEIAFSFERSGIPVSFYDLDAQGGTLHRTREADGAQVAVVDTPGALQEALSEWLKEADVVVIPTRTTSRDIEPLMRMRKAVFKHSRAKIVYVMNGWNRFKASRDFMEWFEGLAGDQTVVTLPQSEAFVQAGAAPAEGEKRTTLSLSLTVSDKKALKMMAAERETTIAAIIHEWVAEHKEDK